jgi:hypothetical protein
VAGNILLRDSKISSIFYVIGFVLMFLPKIYLAPDTAICGYPHNSSYWHFSEIILNANLMQQANFIDVFLARHVSGTYAHHQEH